MTLSRQKQYRQDAILNAAEDLVRELHATSFSMLSLAKKAGISPATPYNLFGGKASILYALLNRSLDGVFQGAQHVARQPDPFLRVIEAADAAGRFFGADPDYYRPLYQYLLGVIDPVHRPAYMDRALTYWRNALQGLENAGILSAADRELMARTIVFQVVGALDLWVHEDLNSQEFRSHLVHGVSLLLFHIADEPSAVVLRRQLAEVRSAMPTTCSFSRTEGGLAIAAGTMVAQSHE